MKKISLFFVLFSVIVLFGQNAQSPYPIIFVHGLCSSHRTWFEDAPNNFTSFLVSKGLNNGGNINITLDHLRSSTSIMNSKEQDVHLFSTTLSVGDFYTVNFATHASGYSNEDNSNYPYAPYGLIWDMSTTATTAYISLTGISEHAYHVGDILRIEQEFLLVESIGTNSLTVTRGIFNSQPTFHGYQSAVINLSSHSNQAAIAKQGWGIKKAVEAVKSATGKSKVILVGHSMGGLACRQYIQSEYYGNDVAKIVTIGTPHLGSQADDVNTWFGVVPTLDPSQDAMRDLRYCYSVILGHAPSPPYGDFPDDAIYLFGGTESAQLTGYYSTDFNANGVIDNTPIVGLSKSINNLPGSIAYTWIVSRLPSSGNIGDLCVRADRQYPWDETGTVGDTLMTKTMHQNEPQDKYALIRGLDEPDRYQLDYQLSFDKSYIGFIAYRSNNSASDWDYYKVVLPQSGTLKFTITGNASGLVGYALLDASGNDITWGGITSFPFTFSRELPAGEYHFGVIGNASFTPVPTWEYPYIIKPTFTPGAQGIAFSQVQLNKPSYAPGENASLSITLANQLGGATVSFVVSGNTYTCADNGNGAYTKSFKVPNNQGTYPISITASKVGYTTNYSQINLIVDPPVGNEPLTIAAYPTQIVYNGSSSSTITATVKNSNGQPVSGIQVDFTPPLTGPRGSCIPSTVSTNSNGIAQSVYSPENTGTALIQVQTSNNLSGIARVEVTSAGANTYTIVPSTLIIIRTATNIVYELNPYVTLTATGACVTGGERMCVIQTDLGTFQNGTQTFGSLLGHGNNGCGRMDPLPKLTITQSGMAHISLTVGPTQLEYTLAVVVGVLPEIQAFHTLSCPYFSIGEETEKNVQWSPDGRYLAGMPGKLWRVPSFSEMFSTSSGIGVVSFSKTGKRVVFGKHTNHPVWSIFNLETNTLEEEMDPSNLRMGALCWSDKTDDKIFAFGNRYNSSQFNQIIINGSVRFTTDLTNKPITSIDWKGDLLAVTQYKDVYLFNTASNQRVWKDPTPEIKRSAAFSPDGTKIAVIGDYRSGVNNLLIYDVSSNIPIFRYILSGTVVFCSVCWSPDGSKIVCCATDGYVRVIDYSNGTELMSLSGSQGPIGLSWGKNDLIAVSNGGGGGSIKLYAPFDNDGPSISVKYPSAGFSTLSDTVNLSTNITDLIGISSAEFSLDGISYLPLTMINDSSFNQTINLSQSETILRIKATDRGGRSSTKLITLYRTIPPIQPVLASPLNGQTSVPISTKLNWWRTANADSFRLQLARDISFTQPEYDKYLTDTANSFNNLSPMTDYYWRVSAKNAAGSGPNSDIWHFQTSVSIPQTTTLIQPSNSASNLQIPVIFKWRSVSYANKYHIQISTTSTFTTTIFNDSLLADTVHQLANLQYNTQYYWRVRASNQSGPGNWTSPFQFNTITQQPDAPNLVIPSNNSTNLLLPTLHKWNKSARAESYRLQFATDSNFTSVSLDTVLTDTSKLVYNLNNSTKYYWRVKAVNSGGVSLSSAVWNMTTIKAAPQPPNLLAPNNNSIGLTPPFIAKWNKILDADKYTLQVATDSIFNNRVVDDTSLTDTTRTLSTLFSFTKFYWRVCARNIGGSSAWSSIWNFKTLGNPYASVLYTPVNNAVNQPIIGLAFKWSQAKERRETIQRYQFQLSLDTNFANPVINDTTLTDTMKTVNGLQYLINYWWRVRASNEVGWGDWTVKNKFTTITERPAKPVLALPTNNVIGLDRPVTVKWSKAARAEKYRLQISETAAFATTVANDTLTDTTKSLANLQPLAKYYWRVYATNLGGVSDTSDVWNFKTIGPPTPVILSTPGNNTVVTAGPVSYKWFKAKDRTETIITYDWMRVSDTVSMANLRQDQSVTDTIKIDTPSTVSSIWYWRVRAKNQVGWGAYSVWFSFRSQLCVPMAIASGWNMVGVPVLAPNMLANILFSGKNSAMYEYNNGYVIRDTLVNKKGYWVRYPAASSFDLCGSPLSGTIPLVSGWNMITVFDRNIGVSGITTTPPGIINSLFYGFVNGYSAVDTLKPGKGYWVRTSAAGVMNLPAGLVTGKDNPVPEVEFNKDWARILVLDAAGDAGTLYLAKSITNAENYALPPVPPAGVFDVRFGNQSSVSSLGTDANIVLIQSISYPVSITAQGCDLLVKDKATNGRIFNKLLKDGEGFVITNPAISVIEVSTLSVPLGYELFQAYPNPFNPATNIKFSLPEQQKIRVAVYNHLGQEVAVLAEGVREAGFHEVTWNAIDVPSGVYYYDLTAGSFRQVKKAVLLK